MGRLDAYGEHGAARCGILLVIAATSACAALGLDNLAGSGLRPGVDVPSGPGEVAAAPLGAPPLPPAGVGGYAFSMTHEDGSPVAFDPCRAIHYVVRPDGQPDGRPRAADAGRSRRSPRPPDCSSSTTAPRRGAAATRGAPYQPDRYGDRWAPVLVAWSSAAETSMLADGVLGRAGPDSSATGGCAAMRLVSGLAVFNGAALDQQLRTGDDSKARVRAAARAGPPGRAGPCARPLPGHVRHERLPAGELPRRRPARPGTARPGALLPRLLTSPAAPSTRRTWSRHGRGAFGAASSRWRAAAGGRHDAAVARLALEVVEVGLHGLDCQDRHDWFLSGCFEHRLRLVLRPGVRTSGGRRIFAGRRGLRSSALRRP